MPDPEIFPNAPITEAIIDLRVTLPKGSKLDTLDPFIDRLSERFPTKEKHIEGTYQFSFDDSAASESTRTEVKQIGYVMFTSDKDWAVQVGLNGFSVSKLKPYTQWAHLRDEAKELWNLYKEKMKPESVVRLAVRNINQIEIPLPFENFKDYILTIPEIAPGIPQGLSEFFFRVVIPKPDDGNICAIVTSTLGNINKEKNNLPYMFDIDAFAKVSYDPDSSEIWSDLDKLRDFKNLIFTNSTTEKAKDLFR